MTRDSNHATAASALFTALILLAGAVPSLAQESNARRVAAAVTEYRHNSHADLIVGRLLLTDMLDGTGRDLPLKLVSLYTDQKPPNDISRLLTASHRFPLAPTIADALTLGTGSLAVDGVLLVAEHGQYPRSATGNLRYPKRRFWDETVAVFRAAGKVVPVFIDKHISDNWKDAKHIYDEARALKIPLMAGSSVPGTWRRRCRARRETDRDRRHHVRRHRRLRLPRTRSRAIAGGAAARRRNRSARRSVSLGRGGLEGPRRSQGRHRTLQRGPETGSKIRVRTSDRPQGREGTKVVDRALQRRPARLALRAQRRGERLDRRLASRSRQRKGRRPVDPLDAGLDARGAPRRAFWVAARRDSADDLHRCPELAGGTNAPDQRRARRLAALPRPRRNLDRNARASRRIPANLALERASNTAEKPPLVGAMS